MVMLPGQKDRMRAREYHWRAGLYTSSVYKNFVMDFWYFSDLERSSSKSS